MSQRSGSETASVAVICGLAAMEARPELVATVAAALGFCGSELTPVPPRRPSLTRHKALPTKAFGHTAILFVPLQS